MDADERRLAERAGLFMELLDCLPGPLKTGDQKKADEIRGLIEDRRRPNPSPGDGQ